MYVQDFDYILKHRKGERTKHVNALSRYAINIVSAELDLKYRWRKAQHTDGTLRSIIKILEIRPYGNYKLAADGQDVWTDIKYFLYSRLLAS